MLKIGLTGGIGAGKSYVSKIFAFLDIPIFYADLAAKYLMVNDPNLKNKIITLLGEEAYVTGNLNKQFVASQIFSDTRKLESLNSIVHPAVHQAAKEWFKWQESHYAIEESALIFEAGFEDLFDKIISISAPEPLRIQRVMERDKTNEIEVKKRLSRQWAQEKKNQLSDFVITNDGKQSTIKQVLDIHHELLQIST